MLSDPSPSPLGLKFAPLSGSNQLAAKLTLLQWRLPAFFTPQRAQNGILKVTCEWQTRVKEQSCSEPGKDGRGIGLPRAPLIGPDANGSQIFQSTVVKLLFLHWSHIRRVTVSLTCLSWRP